MRPTQIQGIKTMKKLITTLSTLLFSTTFFLVTAQTYHSGDIAVINNLITENGLTGVNVDDPEGWASESFVTWNNATPQRITQVAFVYLQSPTLTGEVNLSDLEYLQYLVVTGVTNLNVSGCSNLETLTGGGAKILKTLNMQGCSNLKELSLENCDFISLDLSSLASLERVQTKECELWALNVSNLSNLTFLDCRDNYLTALDLSGLTSLTDFHSSPQYSVSLTLSGTEESGYSIARALNNPDFTSEAISYADGILTSSDNTVHFVDFEVETGLVGKFLSGKFSLMYIETYTVTFAGEEIDIEAQAVERAFPVVRPENPVRTGFSFGGWFTEETFETEWNFETDIVTQNVTLYAKWNEATGIADVSAEEEKIVVGYFNLFGQQLSEKPANGIYIILYDNGTTKTVITTSSHE